jgi:hypothetical protein
MGLQSCVIGKSLNVGDNLKTITCIGATCASFHFSTLEEYYTGGLFLGPLNGISDGSLGIIGLFCLMGIFGNGFWGTVIFNVSPGHDICLNELVTYAVIII